MAEIQVPQDLEGEEELEILFDEDDNVLYPEALQVREKCLSVRTWLTILRIVL